MTNRYRNKSPLPKKLRLARKKKSPWKPSTSSESMQLFRSRFERSVSEDLDSRDVEYEYEKHRIQYVSTRTYIPAFQLSNGIYIEVKGWFRPSDRSKHLKIQKQHPEIDIRFLFQNAQQKLSRQSNTTYIQWCERYGFKWAELVVPQGWLNEPKTRAKQQCIFTA